MKITVTEDKYTKYPVYLNEDGEFRCPHENAEVEYDSGGDGITEPGPSWSVYCTDCHNDDLTDYEADNLIEAHISNQEDSYYED
jgi:hypothetical protein